MEIRVAAGNLIRAESDGVIVSVFEGEDRLEGDVAAADRALDGAISQLIHLGEIKGKLNQVTVVHSLGKLPASRVVVVGLGKRADFSIDRVRVAAANSCRALRHRGALKVAVSPIAVGMVGTGARDSARAFTEGALLGLYTFRRHMTKEPEHGDLTEIVILGEQQDIAELDTGRQQGQIVAEAVIFCRDLVNEPSNYMTPTDLAKKATDLASSYGLEAQVLEREEMQQMGMGALLGVAQGSQQPPKLIVLRYQGRDSSDIDVALVGKGITFDSGGISIKPSEGMGAMKGDMAGAASVMAAISAVARLKAKVNVMAVAPATENMPSGTAYKPGDVLKSMSGKTIEIITTDAEGRVILSDALGYARKQSARAMIDVATLTGACVIALGEICIGAFTNNQPLVDQVISAGKLAGEHIWQMPMFEEYKEQIKSDVADVKNSGGRPAGAITAAQFLAEFAGDTPWVHLDIAGVDFTDKERGYQVKGATGMPVRTLINWVLAFEKKL